jgi:hypothetical protein
MQQRKELMDLADQFDMKYSHYLSLKEEHDQLA